jgi:hypothetical protein
MDIDSVMNCPYRLNMNTAVNAKPQSAVKKLLGLGDPYQRGFVVWAVIGLVLAIPEILGSNVDSWFYSISRSVGHFEELWGGTRAIVVALIAVAAVHSILYRDRNTSLLRAKNLKRTDYGHLVKEEKEEGEADWLFWVLVIVAVGIAAGAALVPVTKADPYSRGYVIYGSIAFFFFIIPNMYAYFSGRAAFATLFAIVHKLSDRWRPIVTMIIIAGLAVLIFHLALYPWPSIALTQG